MSGQFNGIYRGIVVDNNDPLQAGRVKVRAIPMFMGVDDEALPWAVLADPNMGGLSNIGGSDIPVIDSHVFLFFEAGDHRYPVYFAGAPAIRDEIPDIPALSREADETVEVINSKTIGTVDSPSGSWSEPNSAYAAEYPNNKVIRTKGGITIELDDTEDNVRLHVYHPSGTRTEINNDGDRVDHTEGSLYTVVLGDNRIYVKGNHSITVEGSTGILVNGTAEIEASGDVSVDAGGSANISAGGNVEVESGGMINITGSLINLNS